MRCESTGPPANFLVGLPNPLCRALCLALAGEALMAFRVNYNQQRNDRQRVKDQKKQEKLQRREEDAARRRAERAAAAPPEMPVDDSQHD